MPTNSESTIRGGYQPFQLKRDYHLDIFGNTLDKITQQHEKAIEQQSAISAALADIKLNEAEDEWKANYIADIQKQIDNASQFGNYSTALDTAKRLAGEAFSNPALRGRMRYNENREKWIANLENRAARGEIDSDTLARAKAQNVYDYQDKYDDNGRIVGGNDWAATFEPVKDLNLDQVFNEIRALVTPSGTSKSSSGGTSQVYLDAKGNQTTDASLARGVFSTVKGGGGSHSETGVTAQQWADAYDAWMRAHPEAARQFEQKRQNTIWLYKQDLMRSQDMNLSAEDRASAKANADVQYAQLTDGQGGLLSAENYARSIANPMFKVMEYSKTADSSEGGSTLLNEGYLKNKTLAEAYGMTVGQAELYGMSSPIEQMAILKDVASNTTALTNAGKQALSGLQQSFGGSTYNYTAPWQQ